MVRFRNLSKPKPSHFARLPEVTVEGFLIEQGEVIRIKGEHGIRFKFDSLVTNKNTGAQWIDCYEVYKHRTGCLRSFKIDRIKRIPKRRKRIAKRRTDS